MASLRFRYSEKSEKDLTFTKLQVSNLFTISISCFNVFAMIFWIDYPNFHFWIVNKDVKPKFRNLGKYEPKTWVPSTWVNFTQVLKLGCVLKIYVFTFFTS